MLKCWIKNFFFSLWWMKKSIGGVLSLVLLQIFSECGVTWKDGAESAVLHQREPYSLADEYHPVWRVDSGQWLGFSLQFDVFFKEKIPSIFFLKKIPFIFPSFSLGVAMCLFCMSFAGRGRAMEPRLELHCLRAWVQLPDTDCHHDVRRSQKGDHFGGEIPRGAAFLPGDAAPIGWSWSGGAQCAARLSVHWEIGRRRDGKHLTGLLSSALCPIPLYSIKNLNLIVPA